MAISRCSSNLLEKENLWKTNPWLKFWQKKFLDGLNPRHIETSLSFPQEVSFRRHNHLLLISIWGELPSNLKHKGCIRLIAYDIYVWKKELQQMIFSLSEFRGEAAKKEFKYSFIFRSFYYLSSWRQSGNCTNFTRKLIWTQKLLTRTKYSWLQLVNLVSFLSKLSAI